MHGICNIIPHEIQQIRSVSVYLKSEQRAAFKLIILSLRLPRLSPDVWQMCSKLQVSLPWTSATSSLSHTSTHHLLLDSNAKMPEKPLRFLIWGGNGWIAGHLKTLLKKQGKEVHTTTVRMEDSVKVAMELQRVRPTHVLNSAGCTGRPNVDWCEDNKAQTVRSNVIGTLNLVDQCFQMGIHCTVFATGCIYKYNEAYPIGGPGYKEEDAANFTESFYSLTKGHIEPVGVRCWNER